MSHIDPAQVINILNDKESIYYMDLSKHQSEDEVIRRIHYILNLRQCYWGRWRLIIRLRKREQVRIKRNYECVLDMLRMRIRDLNAGVRSKII